MALRILFCFSTASEGNPLRACVRDVEIMQNYAVRRPCLDFVGNLLTMLHGRHHTSGQILLVEISCRQRRAHSVREDSLDRCASVTRRSMSARGALLHCPHQWSIPVRVGSSFTSTVAQFFSLTIGFGTFDGPLGHSSGDQAPTTVVIAKMKFTNSMRVEGCSFPTFFH